MNHPHPHVGSVHVGRPVEYYWLGRTVRSSIVKRPVHGPLLVRGVNAFGDDQADRDQHGGADKVLYVYAGEDQAWWEAELVARWSRGSSGRTSQRSAWMSRTR